MTLGQTKLGTVPSTNCKGPEAHVRTTYRSTEEVTSNFYLFLRPQNVRKTCDGMNTRRRRRQRVGSVPGVTRKVYKTLPPDILAIYTNTRGKSTSAAHIHANRSNHFTAFFRYREVPISPINYTNTRTNVHTCVRRGILLKFCTRKCDFFLFAKFHHISAILPRAKITPPFYDN